MHRKLGVLLVNLGSPEHPTTSSIRDFLAEFLSDKRVVGLPRLLWWIILHGIILRVRPKRLKPMYEKIWTSEGSPLLVMGQLQAKKLQRKLSEQGYVEPVVAFACCYSKPSIEVQYQYSLGLGVTSLIVLPLYPQYAASTSGVVFHRVNALLHPCVGRCAIRCKRPAFCKLYVEHNLPSVKYIHSYAENHHYIQAIVKSIRLYQQHKTAAEVLVLSFHGLPKSSHDRGDPYYRQCLATADAIRQAFDLNEQNCITCFQSRFGFAEWLQPYTEDTLITLAKRGVKHIQIACPGFSADCLETLEEVAIQLKATFIEHGGESCAYIPALNDSTLGIDLYYDLISSCNSESN